MKRFIVFIISFVLFFSISVPCFASDTEHGGGGGFRNDWTDEEKLEYYKYKGQKIIHEITGIGRDNIAEDFLDRLYPFWDTRGYSSLEEYLLHELGYDEDQEVFVPSQNLTVDINNCIQEYNDSVTMVYRYPSPVQCISAENFPNNTVYQALIKTCMAYPNCYVLTSNSYQGSKQNGVFMALDGSVNSVWFPDCYWWYVIPEPFAGVTQYLDLSSASTTFYNDNWEDYFIPHLFLFTSDGRCFYQVNEELAGYGSYYAEFDIDNFPLLDDVDKGMDWVQYGTSYTTFLDSTYSASLSARTVYSASPNALNVYKSFADMKKDIGSQVIGFYSPNYTGSCVPSVDVNVINNYEIPDSGGGSSSGTGSDDNGGSSGGSIFDDIISGIASGVGSIIKGIFSIIKDLVDAVADAIVSITKSITDMSSLLRTNFTDFLSAVFPFLPQEFVKIMIAGLTLCLLGIIIKIFRG